MALEHRFFTAALGDNGSDHQFPPPRALVIDFDETLTTRDTTPAIISAVTAAAAAVAAAAGIEEDRAELESDRAAMTAALVRLYMVERAALFDECFGPEKGGKKKGGADTPSPFDPASADAFTSRLSAFDRAANGRAVEAGILAGAPGVEGVLRSAASAAVKDGLFRPGAVSALRAALAAGTPTAILSVSWSTVFLVAALEAAGVPAVAVTDWDARLRAPSSSAMTPSPAAVAVFANDLATTVGGTSTGALVARCQCAEDKVDALAAMTGERVPEAAPAIYIGDAPSDLAALLAADVGLVVDESASLRRAAAGVGATLLPLAAIPSSGEAPTPGTLYAVANWAEVTAFVAPTAAGDEGEGAPGSPPPSTPPPPRVLSIAGSDSGGGAGIQADLKTCSALGVYGATAITAVTVQNSRGVSGVHAVPPGVVGAQIAAVLGDIGADAIKTGMLPTAECVGAVADALAALPSLPPLVVDPVLVATSGDSLAGGGVGRAMVDRLFPLATVVTPNLIEAAALLGRDVCELEGSLAAVEEAARELAALGPAWVLVKGGHASSGVEVVDVLHDGTTATRLSARRVDTPVSHGTGCSLATALAAGLARGLDVPAAAAGAKAYVSGALAASAGLRVGGGPQWAMHHAYATVDWSRHGALKPPPGSGSTAPSRRPPLDLRVYAVTDPALDAAAGRSTAGAAGAAAAGGATTIQIRDKSGDPGALVAATATSLTAIAGRAALLVNDRVDAALAAGADGAHVGQADLPAAGARTALGPGRLLGVSVKTVGQALAAQAAGADYVGAGAIAGTSTKDTSVIGLEGLAAICRAVSIPVVAIGGVGPANAAACIGAGAAGVAVVSAVFGEGVDTVAATAELRVIVDGALAERDSRKS